jgi:hypothetical protein
MIDAKNSNNMKDLDNTEPFETRRIIYKFKNLPNWRFFPQKERESIVEQIKEISKHNRGLGEFLSIPETSFEVDLQKVSHLYSNPELIGDELHLDIKPLKTPNGIILNGLFWDDARLQLGLRGTGNFNRDDNRLIENYHLMAIDIIMEYMPDIPQTV